MFVFFFFPLVGPKVTFFQPDDEVVGKSTGQRDNMKVFGFIVCLEVGSCSCLADLSLLTLPPLQSTGILPLDAEVSGLCDVVLIHEHHLGMSFEYV